MAQLEAMPETTEYAGVAGRLVANGTVCMLPGLKQWMVSAQDRHYKAHWEGFLCPSHVSLGASGGCTRIVVGSVHSRSVTAATADSIDGLAQDLAAHLAECAEPMRWSMLFTGHSTPVCACCADIVMEHYSTVCSSRHEVTFHMEGRCIAISVSEGVLLKATETGRGLC